MKLPPRKVVCENCGNTFITCATKAKYCSRECVNDVNRKRTKEKKRAPKKEKEFNAFMKDLKKYNQDHGTNISYGQYRGMMNK